MQLVDAAHQRQIGFADFLWLAMRRGTCQRQNLALSGYQLIMSTVDHFLGLSNPAIVSAPSKKSFSKVI